MTKLCCESLKANIIAARDGSEPNLRKQLAYLYHIFDYYGWRDWLVTNLTVRIPNEEALLLAPFGLTFDEITPDNLIKIDFSGNIIDSKYGFQIDKSGIGVPCAIYRKHMNINCILHTHSDYGVAVSNLEQELLLLDQLAMMLAGKVAYHDSEKDQLDKLLHNIKGKYSLVLKNHGLVSIGPSIAETFWFHYYLEASCKVYILTTSSGSKINYPDKETVTNTADGYDLWRKHNVYPDLNHSELLFDSVKRKIGYIFG